MMTTDERKADVARRLTEIGVAHATLTIMGLGVRYTPEEFADWIIRLVDRMGEDWTVTC